MNDCVPDWDMEDSPIPSSSGISRPTDKKPAMPDDELVELVWRNGQLLMQSQTQKSSRKSPVNFSGDDAVLPGRPEKFLSDRPEEIGPEKNHLFIQEDEMVSLLHYPLDDSFEREFCTDMLGSIPSSNAGSFSGVRSHLNPAERRSGLDSPIGGTDNGVKTAPESSRSSSFLHFPALAMSRRGIPAVRVFDNEVRESRVDSNGTPAMGRGDYQSFSPESRGGEVPGISGSVAGDVSVTVGDVEKVHGGVSTSVRTEAGVDTCDRIEVTVTSSSAGAAGSAERNVKPAVEDRKRKARETDESECQSEDIEFELTDPKKITQQSTSARRTRAAEVHNLSERRRRDRINEKMKALQELIPRCNKSDKASMLDEAIEYLKSLQSQVQMMSMGCSMPPMMFPGVQYYMPPMGMGMGMGLGIGMEMPGGLRQPVLPFPQVVHNSNVPASAPLHLGPQIPLSAFHPPSISQTDQSQVHAMNQLDPALNLVSLQNMNPMQTSNFADPYQRYLGLHQMHVPPQILAS